MNTNYKQDFLLFNFEHSQSLISTNSTCSLLKLIDPSEYGSTIESLKPPPDPAAVFAEVASQINDLNIATWKTRSLALGAWNMEFLNARKATYFLNTYREIISRHHLLAVEEVDLAGIAALGRACGYDHFVSSVNTRGQAVGFLVHPRLRVLQCLEYPQLTGIFGIPDLRPALRLNLQDRTTGIIFAAVVVHLKSMRGGLRITSPVRYQQLEKLVRLMDIDQELILILGDFNCFLDEPNTTEPLAQHGYILVNPHNNTATQNWGARIDGLFYKNKPSTIRLGSYKIFNFWRNRLIGNGLSDHGLLSWKMTACSTNSCLSRLLANSEAGRMPALPVLRSWFSRRFSLRSTD